LLTESYYQVYLFYKKAGKKDAEDYYQVSKLLGTGKSMNNTVF